MRSIEQALLIIGGLLIIAELFVPGGIVGSIGAVLVFFSLASLTDGLGELLLGIALFIALIGVIVYILLKLIPRDRFKNTLILNSELNSDEGFSSNENYDHLLGQRGITITILRPSGKIKIAGEIYYVSSEDKFIEKDKQIIVIGVEGGKILVREVGR
ncbi:MAG: NfeD family protein [Peptostreptococcaceae bacterium]|nr:NfeD family protein [Peptostreptococcaceae bacterium]